MELHLLVLLKRKIYFWRSRFLAAAWHGVIPDQKRWKAYTNYLGHLLSLLLGGGGDLAGFFPQIWPHSAGLGAPQESCKPETTPGGAFSRALKS